MNLRRGEIELELGGAKRLLKFGMNTLSEFSLMYFDSPGDFTIQFQKNPMGALRDITYCALKVRASANNLPEDFNNLMVGDWLDEAPQDDLAKLMEVMTHSMSLGNPTRQNLSKAAKVQK
jgi:hypothetical protein